MKKKTEMKWEKKRKKSNWLNTTIQSFEVSKIFFKEMNNFIQQELIQLIKCESQAAQLFSRKKCFMSK